jgi:hypothetical protein
MKHKILSWNMRGLNEGNKCLEGQKPSESVEGGHCLSPRDQAGADYIRFSAEFVEMSVCGGVMWLLLVPWVGFC